MTDYKKLIHNTFEVGIFLKGLNGALEILGGLSLLVLRGESVTHLTNNALLAPLLNLNPSTELFGAAFLLSHGIIKLFLIIALFKKKLWAYPLAIAVFGAFIVYQIFRYVFSPSPWLILLTILDIFVIILTYLEYKVLKHKF